MQVAPSTLGVLDAGDVQSLIRNMYDRASPKLEGLVKGHDEFRSHNKFVPNVVHKEIDNEQSP